MQIKTNKSKSEIENKQNKKIKLKNRTHGFAVYLNYFGICLQSNTLQKAAAVQDVQGEK